MIMYHWSGHRNIEIHNYITQGEGIESIKIDIDQLAPKEEV